MTLPEEWLFLKSIRFWAIVGIALATWLKTDGFISEALATALQTIFGGYTIVRTADRFGDKVSE